MSEPIKLKLSEREAQFVACSLNHYAMTLRQTLPNNPREHTEEQRKTAAAAAECTGIFMKVAKKLPNQPKSSASFVENMMKIFRINKTDAESE